MDSKSLGLRDQVLIAALECSGGNTQVEFTMEDLLVSAWKKDKTVWGLRAYETEYPDSDKIHKEVDGRGASHKGLVKLGLLERIHQRIYRLTTAGLAAASTLQPSDLIAREKADRQLEIAVRRILEHPVFQDWLIDSTRPKYFREAGHFWGIAPGTPPQTVRERVYSVEQILKAALDAPKRKGVDQVTDQRGRLLYEAQDIDRCLQFQATLKKRFGRDLQLLNPKIEL